MNSNWYHYSICTFVESQWCRPLKTGLPGMYNTNDHHKYIGAIIWNAIVDKIQKFVLYIK